MSVKSYENFDLLFDALGDGTYRVRVVHSPAGHANSVFEMPFSQDEIKGFIAKNAQNRGNMRSFDVLSVDISTINRFGERLYTALFSSDISECFHRSLTKMKDKGKGLRICLRLSHAPDLIGIPWEYMYDVLQKRYIGLSTSTPIIRSLDLPTHTDSLMVKGALHVLVMISSPADYEQLDVEREWNRVNDATAELQKQGKIVLKRLANASLGELQAALRKKHYHVFHYIGHGGFDESKKDGLLVLEDVNGKGKAVSGSELGTILYDEKTLRLAILNACNGARTSITDPFAGVCQSLLQQGGVPAVIAMQFEITDQAAIVFASEFYAALIDGYPVDAALAEARKRINDEVNKIEWATPVLYLNTDTADIFDMGSKVKNIAVKIKERVSTKPKWFNFKLAAFVVGLVILIESILFFSQQWFVDGPVRASNLTFPKIDASARLKEMKSRFVDLGNGTIEDKDNNLIWMKCSVGQEGDDCELSHADRYTWSKAKKKFKDIDTVKKGEWRLPNAKELQSLVYCSSGVSAKEAWFYHCDGKMNKERMYHQPTILNEIFPNTPNYAYWSSSKYRDNSKVAGGVFFFDGKQYPWIPINIPFHIRLVKDKAPLSK